MKAFIFGISGFVGRYLAEELYNAGYEVSGCDRTGDTILPHDILAINLDVTDSQAVSNHISIIKPDCIINLSAISSVGKSWSIPQTTVEVNVIGAINILEAARKLENKPKILFIGSSEEYASSDKPLSEKSEIDANTPYGISKITQERFARLYSQQYGMKVYCVRAFNHTGVGQNETFVLPSFCKQVAEIEKSGHPGVVKVGNLGAKRDFGHVKDTVRAYRMILESDDYNEIYNVGTGVSYGLDELLKYIISLSSQEIRIEVEPSRVRPIDTPVTCCDRSLIKEKIGWEPKLTVFDALKEIYDAFLNN